MRSVPEPRLRPVPVDGADALILRSRLLPRVIGVMMILAGICYVVNTLAFVVSPGSWKLINPTILLPILLADLSLALWPGTAAELVERRRRGPGALAPAVSRLPGSCPARRAATRSQEERKR